MKFTPIEVSNKKMRFVPVKEESSLTRTLSTSQPQKPTGDPVTDALLFTQKEIVGPVARGADVALFGIPKAVTKKVAGEEFAKQAFPEQSTMLGKTLRFGSEATGLIGGGIGKTATAITSKLAPTGSRLLRKTAASAVGGGAAGLLTPTEDFTDIQKRGEMAAVGTAFGAALPPTAAFLKNVPEVAKAIGQNIHNNLVRLPTKAFRFSKDPLDVFAKEKIVAGSIEEYAQKATELLEQRTTELNQAIAKSTKKLDIFPVVAKHVRDAARQSISSLKDRTAGINELKHLKAVVLKRYGNLRNITVQKAVELRRQLADDFPFIAEDPNNINTKAAHKIYHDIGELIEVAQPEIKELNHRVSGLIDIKNAAINRAAVESRNNPFSLLDSIVGLGGWAGSGKPLVGGALVGAKKTLGSTWAQTRFANALISLSDGSLKKLVASNPWVTSFATIKTKLEDKLGKSFIDGLDSFPRATEVGELYAGSTVKKVPAPNVLKLPAPKTQPATPKYLQERQQIPTEDINLPYEGRPYTPGQQAEIIARPTNAPQVEQPGSIKPGWELYESLKSKQGLVQQAQKNIIKKGGLLRGNKGEVYIGSSDPMKKYKSFTERDESGFKMTHITGKDADVTASIMHLPDEKNAIYLDYIESHSKGAGLQLVNDLKQKYNTIYLNATTKKGAELAKKAGFTMTEPPPPKGRASFQANVHGSFEWKKSSGKQGKLPLGSIGVQVTTGVGTGAALWGKDVKAAEQTLGQKNNNPINLKAFENWEGLIGKDKQGHAQFKDLDHGIRAGLKNLKTRQKRQPNQTLRDYMNEFAEENGNKEAEYVAKKLNISPETKLKDINMDLAIIHIAKFESKTDLTSKDIIRVKTKFKLK